MSVVRITKRDAVSLRIKAGVLYGLLDACKRENSQMVTLNRNGAPVDLETFLYWLAETTRGDVEAMLTFAFVQPPGR